MGTVTDEDEARLVRLLRSDVEATIGSGHDARIQRVAAQVRGLRAEIDDYVAKVVEDLQQEFHDLFIDTSWPVRPRHGRHRLWYHDDGWWWCEAAGIAVCRLGALGTLPSGRARPDGDLR